MKSKIPVVFLFGFFLVFQTCEKQEAAPAGLPPVSSAEVFFFDDFAYATTADMEANGWIVRTKKGWPGIPDAVWSKDNVTFHPDQENPDNVFLRMTSSIGATVSQTQICYQRKFLDGTYAARVRFTNDPENGPDGDQVVMSFYAITPYEKPLDPAFSEMDFEYLPNGGWGRPERTMMTTTWETARIEPWYADNCSRDAVRDCSGWHYLVIQAADKAVRYFLDGVEFAAHREPYYPDARMSVNFNLWFIDGGRIQSAQSRAYVEEIDWVFHARNAIMAPQDVLAQVEALRTEKRHFADNVPAGDPPLDCSCDI